MNNYSIYKTYPKKKEKGVLSKILYSFFIKTVIVAILFFISFLFISKSPKNKKLFKRLVYNNSLSFAKIYGVYSKYLGDAIPFKNTFKDNTKLVSDEKITFSKVIKENNGYVLTMEENSLVTALKTGIVIEKKKSSKYINIIKIQDKNGLNITYGYIDDVSIDLYDYVKKGEVIGNSKDKLYLIFEKDNKYLSYEDYL